MHDPERLIEIAAEMEKARDDYLFSKCIADRMDHGKYTTIGRIINRLRKEPDAPKSIDGKVTDKETWIKSDIEKITETINLLSSTDQQNIDKGMEMVANILPFLLVGGFSKAEVVAYLKAKLEAGKAVLADLAKKNEDEDTMIDTQTKKEEGHGEMTMSQEVDPEEKSPNAPVEIPGSENASPENPNKIDGSGE